MEHPVELKNLIEFESKCQKFPVLDRVEVKIEGKIDYFKMRSIRLEYFTVLLSIGERLFQAKLDRVFIHQICGRMKWEEYEGELKITQLYELIQKNFESRRNFEWLSKKIQDVFESASNAGKNLVIIYQPDTNPSRIYGIVSKYYQPTNQLQFRDKFLELCKAKNAPINIENSICIRDKSLGTVEEYFSFNDKENNRIQLECGIVYGKNNGYGSYHVKWKRKIKNEKNILLSFFHEESFNWQNNPRFINNPGEGMIDFINSIVEDGLKLQEVMEERVENCINNDLGEDMIKEVMWKILSRIRVAAYTKERVVNQWQTKYSEMAGTLKSSAWAITESLTFIGTHENAVPQSMRHLLNKAGTLILDEGINGFFQRYEKDFLELRVSYNDL